MIVQHLIQLYTSQANKLKLEMMLKNLQSMQVSLTIFVSNLFSEYFSILEKEINQKEE